MKDSFHMVVAGIQSFFINLREMLHCEPIVSVSTLLSQTAP